TPSRTRNSLRISTPAAKHLGRCGSAPRKSGMRFPRRTGRPREKTRRPFNMLNLRLCRPAGALYRVLCLGAHSDDIEIGCGGTLLSLLERYDNVAVHWVVFSASAVRAREARDSAAAFLAQAREREVAVKNY